MTDVGSQGIRGKRKTTYVSVAILLLIVAVMLAITGYATGEPKLYLVALVLAAIAVAAWMQGRRVTS